MHSPTISRQRGSALVLGPLFALLIAGEATAQTIEFNRDVRPILSANCFFCHGPDEGQRKAKLRLDIDSDVFVDRDGHKAIEPGKPDASELYRRLVTTDHDDLMPPPEAKKTLEPSEIATVRRWIEQGAQYEGNWAFISPSKPILPSIKQTDWARNEIDYFIAARNESDGLAQSAEASRESLIRRATFDLTGLPPTRDEVNAFVNDASPNAYERMIDRLLSSQAYGEHMGRFWLDIVRYGDTHGLHLDNYREMWPYRDWVIRAFNENKPFDVFTTEQLAGDLLPKPSVDQLVASGYNRCNITTGEGGSIKEEVYVRNVVDRVETTGVVFMGLTLGCAVCHDHKFDPLTMKDFYSMFAYFNSIDGSALDGNRKDHLPILKVPTELQKHDLVHWKKEVAEIRKDLAGATSRIDAAQRVWEETLTQRVKPVKADWQVVDPATFTSAGGATLQKLKDKSVLASGSNPVKETLEIIGKLKGGKFTTIRLEALTHESHTAKSLARSNNGNAVLTEFVAEISPIGQPDKKEKIVFKRATAEHEQKDGDFRIVNAIDGKQDTGWAVEGHSRRENCEAVFVAAKPFGFPDGAELHCRLDFQTKFSQHHFGRVRLAVSQTVAPPAAETRIELGDWYSVGTFTSASYGKRSFNGKFGPEGKPFKAEQKFSDNGETLRWVHHPEWTDGVIHGDLPGTESAAYIYRNIYSSVAQKVTVHTGSSDAIKVFVNNKQVLGKNEAREVAANQDKTEISLKEGDNDLMLKLINWRGDAGFYFRMESPHILAPDDVSKIAAISPDKRTPEQADRIRVYFRHHVTRNRDMAVQRGKLFAAQKALSDVERAMPTTLIYRERKEPREAFMLIRGNYDQKGEKIGRRTPAALPPMAEGLPNDRLGLAKWLLDSKHPLTARVAVNRFWQQAFGYGLVKTSGDFGSQGELPSHPGLLDWLAVDFRENGWDVKRLMKQLVMSATYRQSSSLSAGMAKSDPQNRMLARGPRFRLDAEMLRDQALALGGLMTRTLGGPSVRPPQPDGLWHAVGYSGSNTVQFYPDEGDKIYRRSVYTFWKRTSPPPQMTAFDAPSRESCTVQRERTNTPMQALLLLNEPQYVEAARGLAQRAWHEGGKTAGTRAAFLFRQAAIRGANEGELKELLAVYRDHLAEFQKNPAAAKALLKGGATSADASIPTAELAAWTMVANLILNLDEVITKG
ncbi:MAG: PSD1 and planctomycete cytochrome C domain-containing protein [Verrucomicrobiia bacterium]|jgi:hypothetical protein